MKNILLMGMLCSMVCANYSAAPVEDSAELLNRAGLNGQVFLTRIQTERIKPLPIYLPLAVPQERVVCKGVEEVPFKVSYDSRLWRFQIDADVSETSKEMVREYVSGYIGFCDKPFQDWFYDALADRYMQMPSLHMQYIMRVVGVERSSFKSPLAESEFASGLKDLEILCNPDKLTIIFDCTNLPFKRIMGGLVSLMEYLKDKKAGVFDISDIVRSFELYPGGEKQFGQDCADLLLDFNTWREMGILYLLRRISIQAGAILVPQIKVALDNLISQEAEEFQSIAHKKASEKGYLVKKESRKKAKLHTQQREQLEELAHYGLVGVAAMFEKGWQAIISQAVAEKQGHEEAVRKKLARQAEEIAALLRSAEADLAQVSAEEADCWKSLSTRQDAEWSEIVYAKNRRHLSEMAYDTLAHFSTYALSELEKLFEEQTSARLRILKVHACANAEDKKDDQDFLTTARDFRIKMHEAALHQDPQLSSRLHLILKANGVGMSAREDGSGPFVATAPAVCSDDDSARTEPATARNRQQSAASSSYRSDGAVKEKQQSRVLDLPVAEALSVETFVVVMPESALSVVMAESGLSTGKATDESMRTEWSDEESNF